MLELNKQKSIAFDVETTSIDPLRAELVGMSFSWQDCTGYYLPFMAPEGENTLGKDELAAIKKILEDKKIGKTGHNLKYDSLVMRRYDIYLAGIDFDSMLASHLLAGHVRGHSMDAAATRFLQVETIPIKDLIGTGKKQITINQVPLEKVTEYAAEDADIAWRLRKTMEPQIKRQGLEEIFTTLDLPWRKCLPICRNWVSA